MKKIICALDFSSGAFHALEYAITIACVLKADIEMVWVDNSTEASGLAAISRDLRLEVKKQFEELITAKKEICPHISFTYKLKRGKVYQEVGNLARTENALMIIAGSHGVSGFEQHWIGSNAFRIVSHASVPVITLRSSFENKNTIKKIVLPIDSTSETKLKVNFACSIAKAFDAEILLLALFSTKLKSLQRKVESNAKDACGIIENHGIKVNCNTQSSDNITNSTITFAEEHEADLITIMTEKDTSTSSILLGHYAQLMINNSPIPVLSINAGIKESELSL